METDAMQGPGNTRFAASATAGKRLGVWFLVGLLLALSWGSNALGAAKEKSGAETGAEEKTEEVEVTAESFDMDYAAKKGVLEGDVRVADSKMVLTADRMDIVLNKNDELQRVEAIGNVKIRELKTGQHAMAGRAAYDVESGEVVLTEDPRLLDGKGSETTADKITYSRDEQRFHLKNMMSTIKLKKRTTDVLPDILRPGRRTGGDKKRSGDEIDEEAGEG